MRKIPVYFLLLLVACSESEVVENNAPSKPMAVSPSNGAENQLLDITLKWSSTDPENDPISYDLYFDDVDASELVASSITVDSFRISGLDFETIYRWKIIASDNQGNSSMSDEFSFTTRGIQGEWEILHISKTEVVVYDPEQICSATAESLITARIDIVGELFRRWIGESVPPNVIANDTVLVEYVFGPEENNKDKLGVENSDKHYIHPDSIDAIKIWQSKAPWRFATYDGQVGAINTLNDSILTLNVGGVGNRDHRKEHILVEIENKVLGPLQGLPGLDAQQRIIVANVNCNRRHIRFFAVDDNGEILELGDAVSFDDIPKGGLP